MANVTISIDDEMLKRAKKIAIDRETSSMNVTVVNPFSN